MASLTNLLMNGVFIEIGPGVEERMNKVSALYSRFTGYVADVVWTGRLKQEHDSIQRNQREL